MIVLLLLFSEDSVVFDFGLLFDGIVATSATDVNDFVGFPRRRFLDGRIDVISLLLLLLFFDVVVVAVVLPDLVSFIDTFLAAVLYFTSVSLL